MLAELVRDPQLLTGQAGGPGGAQGSLLTMPHAQGRAGSRPGGPGGGRPRGAGSSSALLGAAGAQGGQAGRGPGIPGTGGAKTWGEAFHASALELIAMTATTEAAGRTDRVTAAMGDAAGGPALNKIERAAIAAATPITYAPQELLLLSEWPGGGALWRLYHLSLASACLLGCLWTTAGLLASGWRSDGLLTSRQALASPPITIAPHPVHLNARHCLPQFRANP